MYLGEDGIFIFDFFKLLDECSFQLLSLEPFKELFLSFFLNFFFFFDRLSIIICFGLNKFYCYFF